MGRCSTPACAGEKLSSSERRSRSGVRNTCAGMVSVATVWNGETVSSQRGAASWTGHAVGAELYGEGEADPLPGESCLHCRAQIAAGQPQRAVHNTRESLDKDLL